MKNQGTVNIWLGFRQWVSASDPTIYRSSEQEVPFAITDFGFEKAIADRIPVKTFESGCKEGQDCSSGLIDEGVKLYVWLGIALLIIVAVLVVICFCCFRSDSSNASRTSFGATADKTGTKVGKRSQQESQKEGETGTVEMEDQNRA